MQPQRRPSHIAISPSAIHASDEVEKNTHRHTLKTNNYMAFARAGALCRRARLRAELTMLAVVAA